MIGVLTQTKPSLVEEAVDRLRERVAHARRRADHVGARPQVRDLAQELERVRLGLDRIGVGIVDPADDLDRARLHLERLALRGRRHDRAGRLDRAAGGELLDLVGVVGQRVGRDHLHRMERRSRRRRCTKEMPALESRRVRTQPLTVTGVSFGASPARMARTLSSVLSIARELIRRSGLVQAAAPGPHGAISPIAFLRLSNGFGPAPCAGAIVFTSRLFAVMTR